jgi:translation initiation factor IF-2
MRIHELAKKYNLTNDELIDLLNKAGYDVKNHMSNVDYDMLAALDRHFSWSAAATTKKKTKAKAKKAKKAIDDSVESKAKAKIKAKTKLIRKRTPPKEEKAPAAKAKSKVKAKAKAKVKAKAKAKTETKTKAKAKAKAKAKSKAKVKSAAEPAQPAAEAKSAEPVEAKAEVTAAPEAPVAKKEEPAKTKKPEAAKPEPKKPDPVEMDPVARALSKLGPAVVAPPPMPAPEPPAAEKKPKRPKRAAKGTTPDKIPHPGKPGRRQKPARVKKTPAEVEAQQKLVRESVRRTLAKLETTRKTKRRKPKPGENETVEVKPVAIQERSNVSMLASALGVPAQDILACCDELGVSATLGTELSREAIEVIAESLDRAVDIEAVYGETRLREEAPVDPSKLRPRAPVVTVMGHVDHGKTSILDYIRKSRVAAGEAGGITQHIGAYEVETPQGKITFIDTPGHEAFTSMRARGAQLTDIVVLVVAADDGVMPQTIEAINHTRAAGVPLVVAVNKIDIPGVNPAGVKQQLMQYDVQVEEFGGETVAVDVSARNGTGIDKLLEMILLQAELLELKADPTCPARGVVIEVKKEEGRGVLATLLVQHGTLKVGDVIAMGNEYGKVRSLVDHSGKRIKSAGPSVPVQVLGANGVPEAGDTFIVVKNERDAREISDKRLEAQRNRELQPTKVLTLEDLYAQIHEGNVKELKIIVKADTNGSAEALRDSLDRLAEEDIRVKVIHAGVGVVSESDVLLATTSEAIIIAFNTKISPNARDLADRKGIDVRGYRVIYEALEDVTQALRGMLEPIFVERVLGKAEVRQLFRVSRLGTIAGSMVIEGTIARNASARVIRDGEKVFDGKIGSLKRFQDDVREVSENFECGIGVSGFEDLREGDVIEAYVVEEKVRVFA